MYVYGVVICGQDDVCCFVVLVVGEVVLGIDGIFEVVDYGEGSGCQMCWNLVDLVEGLGGKVVESFIFYVIWFVLGV